MSAPRRFARPSIRLASLGGDGGAWKRHLRFVRNLTLLAGVVACGSGGSPAPGFRVTNLQVMQSIQTFARNSLPLVADKPTYVRAFLTSEEGDHGPWKVSARLNVFDVATSQQHDLLPISFDPDYAITVSPTGSHVDRWDDSFTFVLDYLDTKAGDRVFTVRVFSGPEEANPPPDHVASLPWTFHPAVSRSTYGVVWAETELDPAHKEIPISPAAPWTDFEAHRKYVESAYPLTHFGVSPMPGFGKAAPNPQPFTTLTGANSWAFSMLTNLPAGSRVNLLCNWDSGGGHGWADGKGLSEEENPRDERAGPTMAQEFGHLSGIWCHTQDPCLTAKQYPRPNGHIDVHDLGFNLSGNYGHPIELVAWGGERDVLNGQTVSYPVSDFMSYNFGPTWISSFTYCELVSLLWSPSEGEGCLPGVQRSGLRAGPAAFSAAPQTYLLVLGTARDDGTATLDALEAIPSTSDLSDVPGADPKHTLRLLDAGGMVLLDVPFEDVHSDHDAGGEPPFSVVLPFEAAKATAVKLELLDATGMVLAQRDLPAQGPVVSQLTGPAVAPVTGIASGPQTITWTADDPAGRALHFTLLYSADGGNAWWPLNTRMTGTSAVVDFDSLPGSDAALLKVRASNDGRFAETATTATFRVARRAPQVSIVGAAEGSTVDPRSPLLLEGLSSTWEDGDLTSPSAFSWRSDAGPLGTGPYVVVRSLMPGPLAVTLRATAPDGRTSETTVHLVVGPAN